MHKPPRIAIGITMWKRPDVTALLLKHYAEMRFALGQERVADIELIAVGSEGDASRGPAEEHGWIYDEFPNQNAVGMPKKFSRMAHVARELAPDAFMGVGSDDFMNEAMLRLWVKKLEEGFRYIGQEDYYEVNLSWNQALYWSGYIGPRAGETIGPFRLMSADLLDEVDWTPWTCTTNPKDHDGNMRRHVRDRVTVDKQAIMRMRDGVDYHCVGIQGSANLSAWRGLVRAKGSRLVPIHEAVKGLPPELAEALLLCEVGRRT